MTRIIFDPIHMSNMSLFEKITRVHPKDCLIDDKSITFIVNFGSAGKAVGKSGKNVKFLEKKFSKKVKIVEFSDDIGIFAQNLVYPLKDLETSFENNILSIIGPDTKTKGLLIGRNSQNLLKLKNTLKRYFTFEDVKIK